MRTISVDRSVPRCVMAKLEMEREGATFWLEWREESFALWACFKCFSIKSLSVVRGKFIKRTASAQISLKPYIIGMKISLIPHHHPMTDIRELLAFA